MSDFTLEHGRRYVRRNGDISPPICDRRLFGAPTATYPFSDFSSGMDYREDGLYIGPGNKHDSDLVAEYVPPPEPKWVPFTVEDAKSLVGRFVRGKTWPVDVTMIVLAGYTVVLGHTTRQIQYSELLSDYTFADGSPCGKQVPQ